MNPWIILGGLLLLIAVAFGAHHKGDASGAARVKAEWDGSKLRQAQETTAAILAAVTVNEAEHQAGIFKSQKVINDYETTIKLQGDRIAADRVTANAQRLRIPRAPVCNRVTATAQAASAIEPDGAGSTEYVELPEKIERDLRDLAEDADRDVMRQAAKIQGLQDWARAHGFAGAQIPSP